MLRPDRLLSVALAFEGTVPDWVEIIPATPDGRDGRAWTLDDPATVAAETLADGQPVPVDWEHATEIKAPQGEEAPAAGWIEELQARNGALWGRVAWTPRATEQISRREYRFLSPAILYEADSRRIRRISSVALTNKPNFALPALNREAPSMTLPLAVCTALGLAADASEAQAVEKIDALKGDLTTALNRAETPPLEKFVPRADYDAALNRATVAEATLAGERRVKLDADIDAAINGAMQAGKITPATKGFYTGLCRRDGGLDEFRKFLDAAPVVLSPAAVVTGQAKTAIAADGDLLKAECSQQWNADESLRKEFGSVDAYIAYRRADASGRVRIAGGAK